MPDVAEAGLQRKIYFRDRFELFDGQRGCPGKCRDELPGEWGEVGPGCFNDCARKLADFFGGQLRGGG